MKKDLTTYQPLADQLDFTPLLAPATDAIPTHPIDLIQHNELSLLKEWLKNPQQTKTFLLIAGPQSGYQSWLTNLIQNHFTPTTSRSYLLLWHAYTPHSQAPISLIPCLHHEGQHYLDSLRKFLSKTQYIMQNISQQEEILRKEESYTKEILLLEQQLLNPIRSLAKEHNIYLVEEENIRFKSFPKVQIMHDQALYALEDIDHLYYQKELPAHTWQAIQQQYHAIIGQWQNAIHQLRHNELEKEQTFQESVRTYALNQLEELFAQYINENKDLPAQLLLFLEQVKKSACNTLTYMPAPHHLAVLDAFSLPVHLSLIEGKPTTAIEWLNFSDITNLWGSYDIKENQPQVDLGLILSQDQQLFSIKLEDLVRHPEQWITFKDLLLRDEVDVLSEQSAVPNVSLPLQARFLVTASPLLYEHLLYQDSSLNKLFPFFSLWQSSVTHTPVILTSYDAWLKQRFSQQLNYPLEDQGSIRLIKHFIQDSENRKTISCQLDLVNPIIDYLQLNTLAPTLANVNQAIAWLRQSKASIWLQMLQEIEYESIHIETSGQAIGRVIALVVVDVAQEGYGLPTLLSATATSGKEGLINIEREAGLSGEIHDKGAFIAEAFIRHQFGRYQSLSLTATLAFEQTYDGVEGDSATAAEVCAILSAIANIPLKQSIGITGSMNQHGQMQAIGGISEKIEGFFTLCKARGLTGEHGVILPEQNLQHLFLSAEIIQAIKDKQFHLWPIRHIHQALVLLSPVPVLPANAKGRYPKESFFYKVEEELKRFSS